MTRARSIARLVAVALLVASSATLAAGFATSSPAASGGVSEGDAVAPPRENVTVIATDSNSWLGKGRGGPRSKAELFAVGPNGTVVYYNDSHTRYWDVDPVPGTRATVEYVAADHLTPAECGGERPCTRNVVERVNLSTGEVTRLYGRVTPGKHSTRWHDVDRIDEDHLVVADIYQDRVFVVNTTSDVVTWAWNAQAAYPVDGSGGPFPSDWTHLNDVEYLGSGPGPEFMASVRNHDQVVFLDRKRGLLRNWTLGADGNHSVLFEQHNPDYIPREHGGPAVVVADSENNRLVEYRRADGEWHRTWTWQDARLQWPRDADRLPNGHTLVTDSNGDRVFEVDADGDVVWSVRVAFPYEAERLGTGDESTGGPSANRAGLADRNESGNASDRGAGGTDSAGVFGPLHRAANAALTGPTANALMYVLPMWVGGLELAALAVLALTLAGWGVAELYWSSWRLELTRPVRVGRED